MSLLSSLATILILAVGSVDTVAVASSPVPLPALDGVLCTPSTVTGTVGGIHYNGSGYIDTFTVTDANNNVITITVQPPDQATTNAIASYSGKKAKVEYHNSGLPSTHVFDGIGDP